MVINKIRHKPTKLKYIKAKTTFKLQISTNQCLFISISNYENWEWINRL